MKGGQIMCLKFGTITILMVFLMACDTKPSRQSDVKFDITHHRLVFLYDTFTTTFRDLGNGSPKITLQSQDFLEQVEYGLEIDIKSIENIKDGWGNPLVFQVDDYYDPVTQPRLIEIISAGENGVWGDQDDIHYPDFDKYHAPSKNSADPD